LFFPEKAAACCRRLIVMEVAMRNSAHSPSLIATLSLGLAAGLAAITSPTGAHDDEERSYRGNERLGKVEFPVGCNLKAQVEFNRGMALFHSFWFKPAIQSFSEVLSHDPSCAMAQWGIAFMSLGNPFAWPANPQAVEGGAAAAGGGGAHRCEDLA